MKRIRKIKKNLHLIPTLGYGGAESFLLRLLDYLDNDNILITIIHSPINKKRLSRKGVKYITLDPRYNPFYNYYLFTKLIISLDKEDTIFSWLYLADLITSLLKILFFWKKFKIIWNVRNTLVNIKQYSIYTIFSYSILRSLLKNIPHKIIFNSEEAMDQHIKSGYPKAKAQVIHNGFIKYSEFSNPDSYKDQFNIIYVARLHPQKNHSLLFSSISELKSSFDFDFRLHLIGKGLNNKNESLKTNLRKLKILDKTTLYGLLEPIKVHKLFSKSDITLLLSRYGESFPNVIAEAMLYGTLPIATNIGETKNIIKNHGVTISIDSTPEEISKLIYKYYFLKKNNFDKWKLLVKECQEFASKRFSIIKAANEFNKLQKGYPTNNIIKASGNKK